MAIVRILVDGYSLLHAWRDLAPGEPRHSAEGDDGVAFGEIISDRKGLAVGFEAVGGAFDEVVGGFAFS